jgi:gamma-glutamylcyclotransferase
VSRVEPRVLFFAYGANVHPGWLRRRIPDAALVGAAALPGHRLAFRKRGRDGAARSDACPTDAPGAALPGALYRVQPEDLQRLGAAGAGYRAEHVRVNSAAGAVTAVTWRAASAEIVDGLLPWDWYVALIRAGAELLGLPEAHRAWLDAQPTAVDADAGRVALARAVIAAGEGGT